jgi:hypothetical protein
VLTMASVQRASLEKNTLPKQMTSFQFTLNEQPVTDKEAIALLKAANHGKESQPQIELTKVFNLKKLNTKDLFKQAVETHNQDLATLAWKISVSGGAAQELSDKPRYRRAKVSHKIEPENLNEDTVISVVCTNTAYWSVGVALLMYALNERFHPGVTLKEICIDYVNQAWHKFDLPEESILFNGFQREETNMGPVWSPIRNTSDTPQSTYPTSAIYMCAREGMQWAKEHQLIDIETCISYGSEKGNDDERTAKTQRKYYKLSPTQFGTSVFNKWGDSIELVNRYFANRLR